MRGEKVIDHKCKRKLDSQKKIFFLKCEYICYICIFGVVFVLEYQIIRTEEVIKHIF